MLNNKKNDVFVVCFFFSDISYDAWILLDLKIFIHCLYICIAVKENREMNAFAGFYAIQNSK